VNSPDSLGGLRLPPHLKATQAIPGSSRIFTATDLLRGRSVMLKWSRSRRETGALTREWLLLSRLLTGRFTRPLEFRRIGRDQAYLTYDRIDGSTLDEAFPRLDARGRWQVVHSALEALDGLHRSGVVHGDIRPENLVVRSSDQRVHLLDLEYTWATARLSAGMTYVPGWNPDLPQSGATQTARSDLRALGGLLGALMKDARDDCGWSRSLRVFSEELRSDYDLELLAGSGEALMRLRSLTRSFERVLPEWERWHTPPVALERRSCTARWDGFMVDHAGSPGTRCLHICGPPSIGKRTFVRVVAARQAAQGGSVVCLIDESPETTTPDRIELLRSVLDDVVEPRLVILQAGASGRLIGAIREAMPGGTCVVDVCDQPHTGTDDADVWNFDPLTAREWIRWLSASA